MSGIRLGHTTGAGIRALLGQADERLARGDTAVVAFVATAEGAEEYVRCCLVGDTLRKVRWAFRAD